MHDDLTVRALNNAVAIRSAGGGGGELAGCVVHSDRGGQFRSGKRLSALDTYQVVGRWAGWLPVVTMQRWSLLHVTAEKPSGSADLCYPGAVTGGDRDVG